MNVHKNAKLALAGRALLVERVVSSQERQTAVVAAFGASTLTVAKWVTPWQSEEPPGLVDRSSRLLRSPRRLAPLVVRRVEQLRRRCSLEESPMHVGRLVCSTCRRRPLRPPPAGTAANNAAKEPSTQRVHRLWSHRALEDRHPALEAALVPPLPSTRAAARSVG